MRDLASGDQRGSGDHAGRNGRPTQTSRSDLMGAGFERRCARRGAGQHRATDSGVRRPSLGSPLGGRTYLARRNDSCVRRGCGTSTLVDRLFARDGPDSIAGAPSRSHASTRTAGFSLVKRPADRVAQPAGLGANSPAGCAAVARLQPRSGSLPCAGTARPSAVTATARVSGPCGAALRQGRPARGSAVVRSLRHRRTISTFWSINSAILFPLPDLRDVRQIALACVPFVENRAGAQTEAIEIMTPRVGGRVSFQDAGLRGSFVETGKAEHDGS